MSQSSGTRLRLYHYWRSSSSWRVRFGFALKGIDCELVHVGLLDGAAESPEHLARNPLGFVPVLEFVGESSPWLAESVAILEWAEETHPAPRLLPSDPQLRGRARQLTELINSGTQPIQNLNVTNFHSPDPEEQKRWNQHWIRNGMHAYETLVRETAGRYSMGDALSMPDLFLVPQCYNAERFEIPLSEFPICERIYRAALEAPACRATHPSHYAPS